jgi:hypothetical protein
MSDFFKRTKNEGAEKNEEDTAGTEGSGAIAAAL